MLHDRELSMSTKSIKLIDIDEYLTITQHIFINLIFNLQDSLKEMVDDFQHLDEQQLRYHINSKLVSLRLREHVMYHLDYIIQESRFYNKVNPREITPEQHFVGIIIESLIELDIIEIESPQQTLLEERLPDLIMMDLDNLCQMFQEELHGYYEDRWQVIDVVKRVTYLMLIKRDDFRIQWFEENYKG